MTKSKPSVLQTSSTSSKFKVGDWVRTGDCIVTYIIAINKKDKYHPYRLFNNGNMWSCSEDFIRHLTKLEKVMK